VILQIGAARFRQNRKTMLPMTTVAVRVAPHDSQRLRDEAAQIWAQATARRDGDAQVGSLAEARPLIDAVLDSSVGSMLLVAYDGDGPTVGFAAISPEANGVAEVRYLGVRPDAWGRGVATALMTALPAALIDAGFTAAVLSVYVDNYPAVAVYQRARWTPSGEPTPHPQSHRLEQRYRMKLRVS
jgi:ribosomal protein S18 acetylase RimI-like enzyme